VPIITSRGRRPGSPVFGRVPPVGERDTVGSLATADAPLPLDALAVAEVDAADAADAADATVVVVVIVAGLALVALLAVTVKGSENSLGAVKSFWFCPT
jgi:hypothetical protein